jgi:inorganic pyrophosphatase
MKKEDIYDFIKLSEFFSKPHPWHGITSGKEAPQVVQVYIEIVPGDAMKYELEKETGYLKVDRPQRFSNVVPFPYGLVPQTYCGESIAELCMERTGRTGITGDNDPLDICVITERSIPHGNIILDAKPIGGLRMIDRNEADDKIVAVMKGDAIYGEMNDINELPKDVVQRLTHYFLTYKQMPYDGERKCEITDVYGPEEAFEVINRSMNDYRNKYDMDKSALIKMLQEGVE